VFRIGDRFGIKWKSIDQNIVARYLIVAVAAMMVVRVREWKTEGSMSSHIDIYTYKST
jgi:hypothetical protein